ncbi:MAG: hypothetical protein KAJ32_02835 [Gammaproteobacteria bacterium]|nr:hypothetical protein [Gammaproteobacteria bacterium]
MIHSRILSACFICLFIAACGTQEQTTPVEKTTEVKTAPEKTATQKTTTRKTRPVLNLSIDNIPIDHQSNDDNIFIKDNEPTEKNSDLFETLSKDQTEPNINLSSKLLTDENKLANKEYLESVDGVQINIKGNFD